MVIIFEYYFEKRKYCNKTCSMEQLKHIKILFNRTVAPAMSAPNKKVLAYRCICFFGASGETPAAKLLHHLELPGWS